MTSEEFHRPEGRSVWLGKDLLQTQDWIYQLPRSALAKIDESVEKLRTTSKPMEEIGKDDFSFESIREDIEGFKRELATGAGLSMCGASHRKNTPTMNSD